MTDPLTQFLYQVKLQWKELLTFFFYFVLSWYLVFTVCKFLSDIVEFELDKVKKKYFDKRK